MPPLRLAPLLLAFGIAHAADAPPQAPAPESSVSRWADRCTDFTRNGWAFKAPSNFLQWLDVFSDPGIWLEFGRRGLDPDYTVRSLSSLLDPGTPRNYLEWTNPDIYDRWAHSLADPGFYTSVNGLLFDPGRFMRWVMLPLDGHAWELAGTALSPATWLKWLNAPANPKVQALFTKATDPETARRWLEALGDPKNMPWRSTSATEQAAPSPVAPLLGTAHLPAQNKL